MAEDYLLAHFQRPEQHKKFHLRRNGQWVRESPQVTTVGWTSDDFHEKARDACVDMQRKLERLKEEVRERCEEEGTREAWRKHTKQMHFASSVIPKLKTSLGEDVSQAYCKMLEMLNFMPRLTWQKGAKFRSNHLCEAPGHFILALEKFLATFHPGMPWGWDANTLNPHCESLSADDMFLDDSLICAHRDCWVFPYGTGDIMKWERVTAHRKYNLVTADGSMYTRHSPEEQERLVYPLLIKEADIALQLLKNGGSFVMKIYNMHTDETKELILSVAESFEEAVIYKPLCSKPRTTERYLICSGFRRQHEFEGMRPGIVALLLEAEIYFTQLECHSIRYCLDHFGQKRAEINEACGQVKTRTIRAVMSRIKADMLENSYRPAFLNPRIVYPWVPMFGDNYIEELKKLDDEEKLEEFIRITISEESERPQLFELEWGPGLIAFLTYHEFDTACAFGEPVEVVRHSLFLPPLWMRCLTKVEEQSNSTPITDLSLLSPQDVRLYRHEDELKLVVICSPVLDRRGWIHFIKHILDLSETVQPEGVHMQRLVLQSSQDVLPGILTRFSASIVAFLSIFFFRCEFGEGSDIVRFSQPHYPEDVPPNIRSFLDTVEADIAETVQFAPINMLAELHDEFLTFNQHQWRRFFRQRSQHE